MSRLMTTFSLAEQPEVFFSTTPTSRAVRRLLDAHEVRHIAGRLYTKNLDDPLEDVVRRRIWDIAAGYFPRAVVVDRTAFELRPSGAEHSVFLCTGTRRVVRLPGAVLNCRRGAGPATGDQPFMGHGLFLSSWSRRFLDNARPSRARAGASRTLSTAELEDRLQSVLVNQGEEELARLLEDAESLAVEIGAQRELARLKTIVSALLGAPGGQLVSVRARAARAGMAWEESRLALFDELTAALAGHVPIGRPERAAHIGPPFAFFEAYFSNFIEGTEFLVEEAEDIVFGGALPADRPEDAHDILGTYDLVADPAARARTPRDFSSLEEILRATHARMLAARPEMAPGEYKTRLNRAGQTVFVAPALVRGTLKQGLDRLLALSIGFQRATFAMFLISEVHPFADGNGRIARALANAELTAAGQQRLIIPTVFRDDYLHALRAMSRQANPVPLIRVLDRAQDLCFQLDWTDLDGAEDLLRTAHAFETPAEADAAGVILRLPSER
jgi:fido (protein-threonine AMPylation protein)